MRWIACSSPSRGEPFNRNHAKVGVDNVGEKDQNSTSREVVSIRMRLSITMLAVRGSVRGPGVLCAYRVNRGHSGGMRDLGAR